MSANNKKYQTLWKSRRRIVGREMMDGIGNVGGVKWNNKDGGGKRGGGRERGGGGKERP